MIEKSRSVTFRLDDATKNALQATDPSAGMSDLVRRAIRRALAEEHTHTASDALITYTGTVTAMCGSLVLVATPLVRIFGWQRGHTVRMRLTSGGVTVTAEAPIRWVADSYILRITDACRQLKLTAGNKVQVEVLKA